MMRRVLLAVATGLLLGLPLAVPARSAGELMVPAGFTLERIATVPRARELAVAPNGDLFVGTIGDAIEVVPDAESANPGAPRVFARIEDRPVAGLVFDGARLVVGGQFGVWELPYRTGERSANGAPRKLASVRTSGVSRDHSTTSVAVAKGTLYASVGSSCNACDPELDPTRASIQRVTEQGLAPEARHVRNAIALAANPATGTLWAGVAGQDELQHGHPYEIFDAVTLHAPVVDYGWPYCYEDRRPVGTAHSCADTAVPRVVFPAYETPIGAVFYPLHPAGRYAFPAAYRGGAFVTLHGSWHAPPVPPRVVFVPLDGDTPRTPVDWNDPTRQWHEFVGGFQRADGSRVARPTGVAVGTDGSLFVSEDEGGSIYRIRPSR